MGSDPLSRRLWVWALLALALSLIRHVPLAGEPLAADDEGLMTGRYQAAIQRGYLEHGFWRSGGRPWVTPLPTKEPSGYLYPNHPPLLHWMNHVFVAAAGEVSEASLRAYPILCCALSAAILAWMAGLLGGPVAALVAALLYAALPMTFTYGRMSNYESPVLLFQLVAVLLLLLGKSNALAAGAVFVAVLHDWQAVFVVPAMPLLFAGSGRRVPWRAVIACSVGGCAAVVTYFLVVAGWVGGIGEAVSSLRSALSRTTMGEPVGLFRWFATQGSHLVACYGAPATLLVLGAVPWAIRRWRHGGGDPVGGHLLCWLTVAVLCVGVFHGHAYKHQFFWFAFTPAAVLTAGCAVAALARRSRVGAVLLAVLLVGSAAWNTVAQHARRSLHHRDIADRINARFDEDTLLFAPYQGGAWYLYSEPWIVDHVLSLGTLEQMLAELRSDNLLVRRVAVLIHPGVSNFAELAARQEELGMEMEETPGFRLYLAER